MILKEYKYAYSVLLQSNCTRYPQKDPPFYGCSESHARLLYQLSDYVCIVCIIHAIHQWSLDFEALALLAVNLFLRESFSIAALVLICFFIVNAETLSKNGVKIHTHVQHHVGYRVKSCRLTSHIEKLKRTN